MKFFFSVSLLPEDNWLYFDCGQLTCVSSMTGRWRWTLVCFPSSLPRLLHVHSCSVFDMLFWYPFPSSILQIKTVLQFIPSFFPFLTVQAMEMKVKVVIMMMIMRISIHKKLPCNSWYNIYIYICVYK